MSGLLDFGGPSRAPDPDGTLGCFAQLPDPEEPLGGVVVLAPAERVGSRQK